jgi:hypothetical protein
MAMVCNLCHLSSSYFFFSLKFITPVYKIQSTVLIKDSKNSNSVGGAEMGVYKICQDLEE